jgi:hypothetical protein
MPVGASPKREREYKKLVRNFKNENRYSGREEEVAARIVNKQRKDFGETKDQKNADSRGQASERNLPIKNYSKLTVPQIEKHLQSLDSRQMHKIRSHELTHKRRKGLLDKLTRELSH